MVLNKIKYILNKFKKKSLKDKEDEKKIRPIVKNKEKYELKTIYPNIILPEGIIYKENPETGRVSSEPPNIVTLNQTVACFIKNAKKIVNVSAGIGTFEWFVSVDSSLNLIASESDKECVAWCKKNRLRKNITYCNKKMNELKKEYGTFDLALAVNFIEHIYDYGSFLNEFSNLANNAIITTVNKDRDFSSSKTSPPANRQCVREWNAGEFYWVLKVFYTKVNLYSMQDQYIPQAKKVGLYSTLTPLIAICENNISQIKLNGKN